MPERNADPNRQFETVEGILTQWLKERREVLGKYTAIAAGIDGLLGPEGLQQRQQHLCELLVDYISAGHFEVFHELVYEAERFADGSSELAEKIMPAIADTTEVILAYEEKYGDKSADNDRLRRDLSALGEVLESRFLLEDRLIAGLHNSHRGQLS